MIKRCLFLFLWPLLTACAGGDYRPLPAMTIESAADALKTRAMRLLAREKTNAAAPLVLFLRESISTSIETIAASGAVSAYKTTYTLHFRLGENDEQTISRDEIVLHDESRYLAGRRQRLAVARDLRDNALSQMFYVISQSGGENDE